LEAVAAKTSSQLILANENCNWQPLNKVFTGNATNQPFLLTNAQIINYFELRNTVDSMPANDMKATDSSALNLFQCGHIQDIKVCTDQHISHALTLSVPGVDVLLGRVHMQAVSTWLSSVTL